MTDDHPTMAPSAFALVENLLTLITDNAAVKRRLHALHDSLAATDAAAAKLKTAQAEFAAYEQKTRAELAKRTAELDEQQADQASAKSAREANLADREQRIAELERQWRFVGEDDDVKRGFRTAQFSALMKARAAYGVSADQVVMPPAPAAIRPAFLQSDDDSRRDGHGVEFLPGTTLTRGP